MRLDSVTARHLVVGVTRQPNFAALNRGRHLCSAGRPSGWALAHIVVRVFCKQLIFRSLAPGCCSSQIHSTSLARLSPQYKIAATPRLQHYARTHTVPRWLGSLVVRALDSRLDGREFDFRPPRLVLGWVTVFGRAKTTSVFYQATQANSAS